MNQNEDQKGIIIIGNGIAGISAADAARQNNSEIRITVLSDEIYPSYYRLRLCELFATDSDDYGKIFLYPPQWYENKRINVVLSKRAISILPDEKALLLNTGEKIRYDKLIISSGSSSSIPDIPGNRKKGVFGLRSLEDALGIRRMLKQASRVVISGGGLLGLEAAFRLKQRGMEISIIEFMPHLLTKQLDEKGSLILERKVKSMGIDLYTGTHPLSIGGGSMVEEIMLANGSTMKADIVLFTAGVKPNTDLAKNAGIPVNRGILADKHMMTGCQDIYACGDVAELEEFMPGLWISALNQGRTAGINASGGNAEYVKEYYPYFLNTMGIKLYSIGNPGKGTREYDTIEESDTDNYEYQRLYFEGDKCVGAILMGNVRNYQLISSSVKNHLSKEEVLNLLHK